MKTTVISAAIVLLAAFFAVVPERATGGDEAVEKSKKVVVPGVYAYEGVPPGTDGVLSDLLLNALLSRHGIHAMGPADARSILTAEQQKNLLGCTDEGCMAELAGALGADFLVGGSVGRLDDLYVISLQLIDSRQAKVISRATANIKKLSAAPARIGPLVDELLGAQPRLRKSPAILERTSSEPRPENMDVKTFCEKNEEYTDLLLEPPYSPELVKKRAVLLEDFVLTPFKRVFDRKRPCIWQLQGKVSNALSHQFKTANDRAAALDAKRRMAEYWKFIEEVKLVQDEYARGLEMEKLGTSKRLSGLPFEVKEAVPSTLPDEPGMRAYRKAYDEAISVVERALKAVKQGKKKVFISLFAPPGKRHERYKPGAFYKELRRKHSQGFKISTCPLAIMPIDDVERAREKFEANSEVEVCWRRVKKHVAIRDGMWLRKLPAGWRISRW